MLKLVLDTPIVKPPVTEYSLARLDIGYQDKRVYFILTGSDGSRRDFDLQGPDAQAVFDALGTGPAEAALKVLAQTLVPGTVPKDAGIGAIEVGK